MHGCYCSKPAPRFGDREQRTTYSIVNITISDEVIWLAPICWQLDFNESCVTVRELIRSRVYQEVQQVNLKRRKQANTLIPITSERPQTTCNASIGDVDWKSHYENAIDNG